MVLLGTIVNAGCIIVGTLLGRFLRNIPEKMKETIMVAIGLAVLLIGLQMGMKSDSYLIVILSLTGGAALGEWWKLHDHFNRAGSWLASKMKAGEDHYIAQGFITATLIFIIGAMSVLGALDSGLRGNHDILLTKSVIDGFTAIILASTLGIGVLFAAFPVLVYQGAIALFATQIVKVVPDSLLDRFILEMTAVGGVMIVAIGLNMLGILKVRAANLLPAILIVAVLTVVGHFGII
ncbi:MAG: DUF554 domain-containing protein [Bacillus sp. (in: firmicutes)]